MTAVETLCVFCGSSPGADPAFVVAAERFGATVAQRGLELVYGGASVGLMGVVADAALAAGGRATGVITESLAGHEIAHETLSDLHVVSTMHERKALMSDLSDAFVMLPGGLGRTRSLMESVTWAQLGIHDKPCGILNVDGFFDDLLGFLRHAAAQGFIKSRRIDALGDFRPCRRQPSTVLVDATGQSGLGSGEVEPRRKRASEWSGKQQHVAGTRRTRPSRPAARPRRRRASPHRSPSPGVTALSPSRSKEPRYSATVAPDTRRSISPFSSVVTMGRSRSIRRLAPSTTRPSAPSTSILRNPTWALVDQIVEAECGDRRARVRQELPVVDQAAVGTDVRRVEAHPVALVGRHGQQLHVRGLVQAQGRQQETAILRVRLQGDDPPGRANQPGGQQRVVPEVGADVDNGHAGSAVLLEHGGQVRLVVTRQRAGGHGGVRDVSQNSSTPPTVQRTASSSASWTAECGRGHLVLNGPEHPADGRDPGQVTGKPPRRRPPGISSGSVGYNRWTSSS